MIRKKLAVLTVSSLFLGNAPLTFSHDDDDEYDNNKSSSPTNTLCSNGEYLTLSGSLQSINISPLEQEGKIKIKLTEFDDGEIETEYASIGTSYGQILNPDALPPAPTLINHVISLRGGRDMIYTQGDQAFITGILDYIPGTPYPCAFSVDEYITSFEGSTGEFENATGMVKAVGSINSCPQNTEDFDNSFELSGYVCLQDD